MREGIHRLPREVMEERNKQIVRLYDMGLTRRQIANCILIGYEGVKRVLRNNGRAGNG